MAARYRQHDYDPAPDASDDAVQLGILRPLSLIVATGALPGTEATRHRTGYRAVLFGGSER